MWKSTTGSISGQQLRSQSLMALTLSDVHSAQLSLVFRGQMGRVIYERNDQKIADGCGWKLMKIGNIGYSCWAQCALGIMQPKKWIRSESMEGPKLVRLQTWPNSSFASFVAFVLKNRTKSLNCQHLLVFVVLHAVVVVSGLKTIIDAPLGSWAGPLLLNICISNRKGRFLWWPTF